MRVFVTRATGFIGTSLVPELLAAGHRVAGLSRSEAGIETLRRAGAEAVRGDLADLPGLRAAAAKADGVIHAAFDHADEDAGRTSEADRRAVEALGDALSGSGRPLIVTSGTGLVRSRVGAPAAETDPHVGAAAFPRAATEEAADALIARGAHVLVVRLSQVHDTRRQGRITWHIDLARRAGRVAYVGEGRNRLAAVHVSDAVRLYRLALEHGRPGKHYHAVGEEGIAMRDIAETISARLGLPVASISPEEAAAYFGRLAPLAALDLAAASAVTQQELGWHPAGPGLLADLRAMTVGAT